MAYLGVRTFQTSTFYKVYELRYPADLLDQIHMSFWDLLDVGADFPHVARHISDIVHGSMMGLVYPWKLPDDD